MAYITRELELYIPKREDLWFYQQMMADPETMAYNAGWDVAYAGYHRDTGCIDCPDEALADWYDSWVGNEPERFYAYIKRSLDGAWIGDVNFHGEEATPKNWSETIPLKTGRLQKSEKIPSCQSVLLYS